MKKWVLLARCGCGLAAGCHAATEESGTDNGGTRSGVSGAHERLGGGRAEEEAIAQSRRTQSVQIPVLPKLAPNGRGGQNPTTDCDV